MSIPVSLERLRDEIENFARAPYLLTVSDDDRPHCVAIAVSWRDDELVMAPGNRTLANAAAHPSVSLVWPPTDAGGYSLIVDATVSSMNDSGAGDNSLAMRPTHAVLHRPAGDTEPGAEGCASDCVPVLRTNDTSG